MKALVSLFLPVCTLYAYQNAFPIQHKKQVGDLALLAAGNVGRLAEYKVVQEEQRAEVGDKLLHKIPALFIR
jgi:hypothetical protein